jgi:hypothetical protein
MLSNYYFYNLLWRTRDEKICYFNGIVFAYPCSECRNRVNDCFASQNNMSSVVASASMASTCIAMQATCNTAFMLSGYHQIDIIMDRMIVE